MVTYYNNNNNNNNNNNKFYLYIAGGLLPAGEVPEPAPEGGPLVPLVLNAYIYIYIYIYIYYVVLFVLE